MKIVAIAGPSQCGKTLLITRLIPEFRARGLSVAVIKHCGHGFCLDVEGKPVTLDQFRGTNVILVFYLNDECVHCVEQLKAINGRAHIRV